LLFDLTRLRTLSDISGNNSITSIYTVALAIKLVLLVAELIEKRHLFLERWIDVGPEEASGAISKILYLWVNRVFARGWRSVLTVYNLPALDSEILNATNPTDLVDKWNRTNKMWKDALLWTFIKHYKWSLLAGVIPRLASSFFCFCEPFLVEKILRFTSFTPEEDRQNVSQALIVAYAVMQIGKALSWTLYEHRVYRSITVFRGSLITLIFGKTLSLGTTNASGADAITLMSADIGRIEDSMRHMHEFYASFIDTAVSLWLLFRLLGFSMLGPAAWVIVCLFLGAPIATAAGNAQVPWLESIEERLAVTTKMLGFMKPVKMTGMTEKMSAIIANLRQLEIRRSRLFRMLIVLEIGAAHLSAIFAPVIGFGLFTLLSLWNGSTPLTAPVAFATLGVFRLQEGPLSSIITSVEYFQTIRNSFRRIQEHLVQPERVDPRTTLAAKPSPYFIPAYYIDTDRLIETEIEPKYDETELEAAQQSLYNTKVAMTIQSASAGYSTQSNIVRNLSFQVGRSKTTMIIGPVGSGKSTLIRLLLGEMPHVTGIVATAFTNSAFCPQSPWITWGTIQQNIQGKSDWDPVWYQRVTRACSLSRDFEELPDGDQTNTGTRGSRLSGGQQMRIVGRQMLLSHLKCCSNLISSPLPELSTPRSPL
jgi:ABC-type multidrug transport system fused ATPase/permease subunit